jgi:hypothetical protein
MYRFIFSNDNAVNTNDNACAHSVTLAQYGGVGQGVTGGLV